MEIELSYNVLYTVLHPIYNRKSLVTGDFQASEVPG